MLNRRSFIKIASTLSVITGAPAAYAARVGALRTASITGTVNRIVRRPKSLVVQEDDYEGYGDEYTVLLDKRTRYRVKEGDAPPQRAKFSDLEEFGTVVVKGKVLPGNKLKASLVTIILPEEYDYGGGY